MGTKEADFDHRQLLANDWFFNHSSSIVSHQVQNRRSRSSNTLKKLGLFCIAQLIERLQCHLQIVLQIGEKSDAFRMIVAAADGLEKRSGEREKKKKKKKNVNVFRERGTQQQMSNHKVVHSIVGFHDSFLVHALQKRRFQLNGDMSNETKQPNHSTPTQKT